MANAKAAQIFLDYHAMECVQALKLIASLADSGSQVHKDLFCPNGDGDGFAPGWRVAEAMRQVALDALDEPEVANIEDMTIYKRAMESMAAQFIHPKMTALEMAKMQLGEK